jgi:hypothetical protein
MPESTLIFGDQRQVETVRVPTHLEAEPPIVVVEVLGWREMPELVPVEILPRRGIDEGAG